MYLASYPRRQRVACSLHRLRRLVEVPPVTWLNYDDAASQVMSAGILIDGGLRVDTTRAVRCLVDGGDRERRGWYWLSTFELRGAAYITGSFGVYHGNDSGKRNIELRLDGKAVPQTAEERAAIRKRNAERHRVAAAQAAADAARAAAHASRVWSRYLPTGESAYLKRKGVGAHGVRFDPNGAGTVAVPMVRSSQIVGLQIIRGPDRGHKLEKEYFPKGLAKKGGYHLLGTLVAGGVCVVAEGYATAATIYEAMGESRGVPIAVAVAFDAGNLAPVGESLLRVRRDIRLVFAADDDAIQRCRAEIPGHEHMAESERPRCGQYTTVALPLCQHCGREHGAVNPGVEAARLAAHALGGTWIKPEWPEASE